MLYYYSLPLYFSVITSAIYYTFTSSYFPQAGTFNPKTNEESDSITIIIIIHNLNFRWSCQQVGRRYILIQRNKKVTEIEGSSYTITTEIMISSFEQIHHKFYQVEWTIFTKPANEMMRQWNQEKLLTPSGNIRHIHVKKYQQFPTTFWLSCYAQMKAAKRWDDISLIQWWE